MSTVGIIVNPHAGKDIRRLTAAASQTSDSAKMAIVRQVALAVADVGVDKILLARDWHRLSERAVEHLDVPHAVLDGDPCGTRIDTIRAAERLLIEGATVVVALGGDGTCRDVATGWPEAPLVAISTGTNNVFPMAIDATSAGTAAALVASGMVTLDEASDQAKRITVHIDDPDSRDGRPADDVALIDLALIDTRFVGARAVLDARSIRLVVAAIAGPASTGLSAIAGRAHPVARLADNGVFVRLGEGGRRLRVPLSPGSSETVDLCEVREIRLGDTIEFGGPGMLAFDGERDRPISESARISATLERRGPRVINVERTLAIAAERRLFDDHVDTTQGSRWLPNS